MREIKRRGSARNGFRSLSPPSALIKRESQKFFYDHRRVASFFAFSVVCIRVRTFRDAIDTLSNVIRARCFLRVRARSRILFFSSHGVGSGGGGGSSTIVSFFAARRSVTIARKVRLFRERVLAYIRFAKF